MVATWKRSSTVCFIWLRCISETNTVFPVLLLNVSNLHVCSSCCLRYDSLWASESVITVKLNTVTNDQWWNQTPAIVISWIFHQRPLWQAFLAVIMVCLSASDKSIWVELMQSNLYTVKKKKKDFFLNKHVRFWGKNFKYYQSYVLLNKAACL